MFGRKKKKEDEEEERTILGGLPFFFSLICIVLLAILNLNFFPVMLRKETFNNWVHFGIGLSLGMWFGHIFIRGHLNVMVHEFKHSLLSGLVGNKAKGFKVNSDSGHFKYEYTKESAKYNALISLAPYILPIFTFVACLLSIPLYYKSLDAVIVVLGVGYGCDLLMNIRDIGPHQTDFSDLRGGFKVGLIFVIAFNISTFTILGSWIAYGFDGIGYLLACYWDVMLPIVAYYRGL